MSDVARPILIVAGGTGGHIYPALAIAECLREAEIRTVWLGSKHGLETRIVPQAGIELFKIAVSGVRGRGPWRWLLAPFSLSISIVQATFAVLRIRPMLVLGMGGFASGPGALAAWICRRPLVIHEQNSIPGLTNLLLSRIATKVLQGFPNAFSDATKAITVGNPVRASIVSIDQPEQRHLETGVFKVLIVGGSRGAAALNCNVPKALAKIHADDLEVKHQAGIDNVAATQQRYSRSSTNALVTEFIDDMDDAYRWASVVICRAGAITISELAAAGVASILVPFPHAVDDHQTANAGYLVDSDAALMVVEGPNFDQRLADAVQSLYNDRSQLAVLASRARNLAKPDAAAIVAAHCRELIDV